MRYDGCDHLNARGESLLVDYSLFAVDQKVVKWKQYCAECGECTARGEDPIR